MAHTNSVNSKFFDNVEVTTSTAGATSTATIENTDNTNAASHAMVAITTGGASAGDAKTQYSTTTTTWSIGVDNSVTSPTVDPFVISQNAALGTNNAMSISTGGAVNLPLQPYFLATMSGARANVTGDGTGYIIQFDGTTYNIGSGFNTGTYTFTAPVAGHYLFSVELLVQNIGSSHTRGYMYLVNSARTCVLHELNYANLRDSSNNIRHNGSGIIHLAAGETCYAQLGVLNSTKTITASNSASFFSGILLS